MSELDTARLRRHVRAHLGEVLPLLSTLALKTESPTPAWVHDRHGARVCPWPAVDPDALVRIVADAIEHYVRALLPPSSWQSAIDHPELAVCWDLAHLGPATKRAPEKLSLEHLASHLSSSDMRRFDWPYVPRAAMAKALVSVGDADAERVAELLMTEEFADLDERRSEPTSVWRSHLTIPLEEQEPEERAFSTWPPYAVALVLAVGGRAKGTRLPLRLQAYAAEHFLDRVAVLSPDGQALREWLLRDVLSLHASDLEEKKKPVDPALLDRDAMAHLGRELALHVDRLRVTLPLIDTEAEASHLVDGVGVWDAPFSGYLERLGPAGTKIATMLRKSRKTRIAAGDSPWSLWAGAHTYPAGSAAVRLLTQALWADVILPERSRPIALARGIVVPCMELLTKKTAEAGLSERPITLDGDAVARFVLEHVNAPAVERGVKSFGSMMTFRLLDWLVREGHARHRRDGDRILYFEGSWEDFAAEIHIARNEGSALRDLVEALHATEVEIAPLGTRTRLLTRAITPGRGRLPQRLAITVQPPLLPDYVHELAGSNGARHREARRLVPWVGLPPLVGSPRQHAAQVGLSLRVVLFFRDRARELLERNGVAVHREDWCRMADAAGVPRSSLGDILTRWTCDEPDGAAFLAWDETKGYRLGAVHGVAHEFLVEGARREAQGASAGRKSVTSRGARAGRWRA